MTLSAVRHGCRQSADCCPDKMRIPVDLEDNSSEVDAVSTDMEVTHRKEAHRDPSQVKRCAVSFPRKLLWGEA